jgi:transposase
MSLPLHKRYEIVFLAKNKYGPQFGSSKIAKIMKCNRKTVTRWLNRWEETKDLSDHPCSGAPRITTVEQDQMMVDMALEEMNTTSKTIKDELENTGITVSQNTIQRRLKDAGLKYSKPLSKPLLTEWHRQQRLKWAKSMKNYYWSKVIASDETLIRLHATHKYTWQRPGKRNFLLLVDISVNLGGSCSKIMTQSTVQITVVHGSLTIKSSRFPGRR